MLNLLNNRVLSSFYTLVFVLSLNWFLLIFDSILAEIHITVRIEIIGYVSVVFLLELLVYYLVTRFYRGMRANHLSALFLSLILVVNLLAFLLAFFDPFLVQGKIIQLIEILLLVCMFYALCYALAKKREMVSVLSLIYVAMVGQQIISLAITTDDGAKAISYNQFKKVEFQDKRNVYLVSFDALMPTINAANYLDIKQLDYVSALEQNNARIFKNTFSDFNITDNSLNTVLFLDPDLYRSVPQATPALSGLKPSPVYEIFRNNGYKIGVGRGGWHMLRGKYIDEFSPHKSKQSYCILKQHWYYLQHLGYCTFKKKVLDKYIRTYFSPSTETPLSYEEQVFEKFRMHASTQQPWLNYIYIFSPGHTPRTYTGTEQELIDYREEFTEKQKKTAQYIQMLIDHINTNDPTGIVVIFGDHGPGFSRGMNMNSENADFVIKDFHGVLSAVYPGDTCSSYLGKRDEKEFITPSKLVRQLITCLANGDDPIDWDVDYSGPYKDYKFEDFLYE